MGKWYEQEGAYQEVVVSSRIRLARNVEGRFFESKLNADEKKALAEEIAQCLSRVRLDEENSFSDFALEKTEQFQRRALVEQHLVSPEFIMQPEGRRALISKDDALTFMINEEDHVRMQGLHAGLEFQTVYEVLSKLDDVLDGELHFAYDLRWGYLTACPTNLGTGLRASAMLHLPMTEQTGTMPSLREQLVKMGYTIRGTYGEGSKAESSLYQISNEITLGITEQRAMDALTEIVKHLVNQEMELRQNNRSVALYDQIYRACGILKSARLLTFEELTEGMSALRLGTSIGMFPCMTFGKIDGLQLQLGEATLLKNENLTTSAEVAERRASIVREALTSVEI